MPAHSGRAAQITEYVAAHPGCTRADLLAAIGLDQHNAMPTYCRKLGLIFSAGSRCTQRYYPTVELAHAADATVRAEAKERRKLLLTVARRRQNLRRRARRLAAGGKAINTRPGQCVPLDAGTQIDLDARMTIATKGLGKWESLVVPSAICSAEARPWAHACAAAMESRP